MPPSGRPEQNDLDLALLVLRARTRRARARRGRTLVAGCAIAVAAAAALALAAGTGGAEALLQADCSLRSLRPVPPGTLRRASMPTARVRTPLPLAEISPWLGTATVAIEDRRFYQHGGLDYEAIVRAAIADLAAGRIVEGGSTIEQELARNLYIGNDRKTLSRKLEEACLATKIADRWSRPRILAAYLNDVYYGNDAFGAAAAAETYFGRPARLLTLDQAALLAGLPQAPSDDDPFLHPGAARMRRGAVLAALLATGQISRNAYARADAQPLRLRRDVTSAPTPPAPAAAPATAPSARAGSRRGQSAARAGGRRR